MLFVVKFFTGRLQKELDKAHKDLDSERREKPSVAELAALKQERDRLRDDAAKLDIQKKDLETEVRQVTSAKEEMEKSHTEAMAALNGDRDAVRAERDRAQAELKAESNRTRRALARDSQTWNEKVPASVPEFRGLAQEGRHTPIISVLNLKGGVGKTTVTANLGAALDTLGYRVLFVDLDLQGSLSGLFLDEATQKVIEQRKASLEDFLFASFGAEFPNLHDYIHRVLPDQKSGLVPTSDFLAYAEADLTTRWRLRESNRDVRFLLRKQLQLKNVTNEYDVWNSPRKVDRELTVIRVVLVSRRGDVPQ